MVQIRPARRMLPVSNEAAMPMFNAAGRLSPALCGPRRQCAPDDCERDTLEVQPRKGGRDDTVGRVHGSLPDPV